MNIKICWCNSKKHFEWGYESHRTIAQFFQIALTAVTTVHIGKLHAIFWGSGVLFCHVRTRKHETYFALHIVSLAKCQALLHWLQKADPPCGSQFGLCGFCGERSGTGIVLLISPVSIIRPILLAVLTFTLRLSEGQAGEYWEPSTIPRSFKLCTFSHLYLQPLYTTPPPPLTRYQCHKTLSFQIAEGCSDQYFRNINCC